MWTPVIMVYVLGLVVTSIALLRTQLMRHSLLMNIGSIALWPLYWGFFLTTMFLGRRRP